MVRVNESNIKLDHIVVFERDNRVFAAAREYDTRRICLFLINEQTGDVFSRNGRTDSWAELYGEQRSIVVNKIYNARHNQTIPVYRFRGAFSS